MRPTDWVARFRDGPAADTGDRVFVVGAIWEEIRLVPIARTETRPPYWAIVGGDGVDGVGERAEPWPGEVTYRLVEVARVDDERVAFYEFEP